MAEGYGSHEQYMGWVEEEAQRRQGEVEIALRKAFRPYIEERSVEVVLFSEMDVLDLARALRDHPIVLKPLLTASNTAARAVERDLGLRNLDTYRPRLTEAQASALAVYLKRFLPGFLAVPALCALDRAAFVDKEIRLRKGRWERSVLETLSAHARVRFRKRKFAAGGETFELDAASPEQGDIRLGVDVKRIEARRDIHKRCDEIVNKAAKLKTAFPGARFAAVIYYPFVDEHINVESRLRGSAVDALVFAGDSRESVENAVRMLLARTSATTEETGERR